MIIYTVFTALNLIGMGYLFYIHEIQKGINREFLTNMMLNNIIDISSKEKIESLEKRIEELEKQLSEK